MKKAVNLNIELINKYVENNESDELAEYLKSSFALERASDGTLISCALNADAIDVMLTLIEQERCNVNQEVFRALRNYVINPEVAGYLCESLRIFEILPRFLHSEMDQITLKLALQFLNNFITHKKGVIHFQDIVPELLTLLERISCIYEVSALLYNIALNSSISMVLQFEDYNLIFALSTSEHSNEFLQFLIEMSIFCEDFWQFYEQLNVEYRVALLTLIKEKQISIIDYALPQYAVEKLSKQFTHHCETIFKTVSIHDKSDLSPCEVSLLLDVLSSLSGREHGLNSLRKNKDFVINAGAVLINIHNLSKTPNNYFTKIEKLSEIREPSQDIQQHPAFGFKAGLIRIIGNLCWKDKGMQDLMRTAELIPVILDCCNMDARNPYIMQWVILAIRNLCEDNPQNQAVIAGMHQQGTVSSAVLAEMGLSLHGDGENAIKIVPLDSIRNKQ